MINSSQTLNNENGYMAILASLMILALLTIPSGFSTDGQAQLPAFIRLDNTRERLYISGTRGGAPGGGSGGSGGGGGGGNTGGGDGPVQRAPKLGVTYWMQIFE